MHDTFIESLELNKDYVYVLVQNGGLLEKKQILIPQTYLHLLFNLKNMRKCDMFCVLEVQDCFQASFPEAVFSGKEYSYVYPSCYSNYNVNLNRNGITIRYPKLLDEHDYEEVLEAYELDSIKYVVQDDKSLKTHLEEFEKIHPIAHPKDIIAFLHPYLSTSDLSTAKSETEKYEKTLKEDLIDKCEQFIYAYQYNQLTDGLLLANNRIKMFSTEQCGWKCNKFPIIDNVDIIVESNFAFGRSSYFRSILTYKGINILSYSAYVHYYYANMIDLCRCTRSYNNNREEWSNVFDFVVQTVNNIRQDPKGFEQTFILDEVKELMQQLRKINDAPDIHIEALIKKDNQKPRGYSFVNNFKPKNSTDHSDKVFVSEMGHNDNVELFAVYPQEKVIVDKINKVSGALYFLDNLRQLSSILPQVDSSIKELSAMNSKMLPLINDTINNIEVDVENLKEKLSKNESGISFINSCASFYFQELTDLFQKCKSYNHEKEIKISDFGSMIWQLLFYNDLSSIEQEYQNKNQAYKELKNRFLKLDEDRREIKKLLHLRGNLINSLNESKQTIEKYIT